jgi:hypothetical protein
MVIGVAGNALFDPDVGTETRSVVISAAGPAYIGLFTAPRRDVVPSVAFEAS